MSDPVPELQFDRATYAAPSAGGAAAVAPCGGCKRPLADQYWKWHRLLVCETCRDGLDAKLRETQSASAFGKAFLQGGGAALACGVAYAIFVAVSNIQFALATIGIAIVVAQVVRKASGGVSGRRFQLLAVALTYVASTMGYAPAIFRAVNHSAHPVASPLALVLLVGVTLISPFLEITEAPLGALIIGIGLWEAWRRTRAVPLRIEGPFRVAPPPPPAPEAAPATPAV
jgi:hypothetical protein